MRSLYRLKGSHPVVKAKVETVTLNANMHASWVREAVKDQRLQLAEREHERSLEWQSLRQRHAEGERLVTSRWFRRQIRQLVKKHVQGKLLTEAGEKLGKLRRLLKIDADRNN